MSQTGTMAMLGNVALGIVPKLTEDGKASIASQLGQGMGGAGTTAGGSFGSSFLSAAKKYAAPLAALFSAAAVKKFASDSVDAFTDLASQTKGLQRIIGGTAEEVSGMAGAMKLSGMDTNAASSSLTIFSKKLEAAQGNANSMAKVSDELGTAVYNADGSIRPMSQLLPEIADKFAGMEDGAEKTALACAYFGRSGTAMLPFLNKGSAGINELTAKAKELGIVIDDDGIKKFGEYKAALREWDTAIQGAKVTIGGALVPFITMGATALTELLVPAIQTGAAAISQFFEGISSTIDIDALKAAFAACGDAFAAAFPGDGGGAATFGQIVGQALNGLIGVVQALSPLFFLLGVAIRVLTEVGPVLIPILIAIGGGLKAMEIAQTVSSGIQALGTALGLFSTTGVAAGAAGATAAAGETAAGTAAAAASPPLFELGAAVLMIGGGVLLAAAGIFVLAQAAIQLADAGMPAAVAMGALVLVIAGLAVGAALLGPALTAGAVGMLAFGAAVLMAGVGIGIAAAGIGVMCAGFALLVEQLPIAAQYGYEAGNALLFIAAAMMPLSAMTIALAATIGALGIAMLTSSGASIAFTGAIGALAIAVGAANFAFGDLDSKMGTVGWGMQTTAEYGDGATSSLWKMAESAGGVRDAVNPLSDVFAQAGNACIQFSNQMQQLAAASTSSSNQVISTFRSMTSEISSVLSSAKLQLPRVETGPLPHYTLSGSFDPKSGRVPTVGVNWYAKGGLFTNPTIVGLGEAGDEAAMPLNSYVFGEIADGISQQLDLVGGSGNAETLVIPVYIGNRKIEEIVIDAQNRNSYRRNGVGA